MSDRSVWSSIAYQGTGRGLDVAELVQVNSFASNNVWPDIVVYIDVPVEDAIARRSGQSCDRIEGQGAELQNAARSRYLQLADERPEWLHIDGLKPAADVFDQVFHQVTDRLRKN